MDRVAWRDVISSTEDTLPLYDEVNEIISLGLDSKARTYAARKLMENNPRLVLDSGAGPGTMTMILLQQHPQADIVALDYSTRLLESCKDGSKSHRGRLHLVRACFEELPFRRKSFDAAITAYALRDSTNLRQAIDEYSRSIKNDGRLAIVELGKPDNIVKRFFATAYVKFIVPLIAGIIVLGRLEGNPWRMIAPTYRNLPRTCTLLEMLERGFDLLERKAFLAGGILILFLRSRSS
jgi:demethylmenaquinone methyltransferase/2-methoxy-6-polyprenyl-1,4-benzoquinol methylase